MTRSRAGLFVSSVLLLLPVNAFADTIIARLTLSDPGVFTCCPPVINPPTHFLDATVLLEPNTGPFFHNIFDSIDMVPDLYPTGHLVTFIGGTFDGEPIIPNTSSIFGPPGKQWLYTTTFNGNTSWWLGHLWWQTDNKYGSLIPDTPSTAAFQVLNLPPGSPGIDQYIIGQGVPIQVLQVPESPWLLALGLIPLVVGTRSAQGSRRTGP